MESAFQFVKLPVARFAYEVAKNKGNLEEWTDSLAVSLMDFDLEANEFGAKLLLEAAEFREKKKQAGRKGGLAKPSNGEQNQAKPSNGEPNNTSNDCSGIVCSVSTVLTTKDHKSNTVPAREKFDFGNNGEKGNGSPELRRTDFEGCADVGDLPLVHDERRSRRPSGTSSTTCDRADVQECESGGHGKSVSKRRSVSTGSKTSLLIKEFPDAWTAWNAFPPLCRERSSTKEFLSKWKDAIESGLPEIEKLIEVIEKWKQSKKWNTDNGQYQQGAHRWIEQRQWENIPTPYSHVERPPQRPLYRNQFDDVRELGDMVREYEARGESMHPGYEAIP
jgi:hypothetical protein